MTIPQAFQLAMQQQQAGRLAEAEGICRQILAVQPNHPDALHLLGILAHQAGRAGATDFIRQAIALDPHSFRYQINLGNVLSAQGRLDDAIAAYRGALQLNPHLADTHYNLGIALQNQGHLDNAIVAYRAALQLKPDFAMAHNNLGAALKAKGLLDEAVASYRRALQFKPDYADAFNNLGVALQEKRLFDDAVIAFRRALRFNVNYADACYNLGNALQSQGNLDEAIAAYHQALQLEAGHLKALTNLGNALQSRGRLEESVSIYRRALQIKPDSADILNNLGGTLKDQGRFDEAIASFEHAMRLRPESSIIHSNILAVLHYRERTSLPALLEAHTEYDRRHTAPFRAGWRPHENSRDPDRPLRLGFISPHFASHPVGRFLIRPLENLDPRQFQVACYSDTLLSDDMTARIYASTALWRDVSDITDEQLSRQIREDGVDILIDLAGHTAGNRLLVFARKPAPIQITWLDYVGTTGLAAMDYILADSRQIPEESSPSYRENVLRMPDDYICFDPRPDAPPVGPLPAVKNGRLTFASFNISAKISPRVIGAWAKILHRVPSAQLMLKNRGFDDPATSARYHRSFAEYGIDPDRLVLCGWSAPGELLAHYGQVDIALDTFPYNGGLTTCEAIWMGVPVITCPGETFASRHGLAHLTAAGMTETIARNLDEYVNLAVELAGDLDRLAAMRAGLRERVAASPLCDGGRFASHFSRILRDVWRQWASQ